MKQILITFPEGFDIDGNPIIRDAQDVLSSGNYTKIAEAPTIENDMDPADEGSQWLLININDQNITFDPQLPGVGDLRPILNPAAGWRVQGDTDIAANEIRFQAVPREKQLSLIDCLQSDFVQWSAGNITSWPQDGVDQFITNIVKALGRL